MTSKSTLAEPQPSEQYPGSYRNHRRLRNTYVWVAVLLPRSVGSLFPTPPSVRSGNDGDTRQGGATGHTSWVITSARDVFAITEPKGFFRVMLASKSGFSYRSVKQPQNSSSGGSVSVWVCMYIYGCVFKAENKQKITLPSELNVLVMQFGPGAFNRAEVPSFSFCFSSMFCLNLSHKLLKLAGSGWPSWQLLLPQTEGVSWLTPKQPFPSLD